MFGLKFLDQKQSWTRKVPSKPGWYFWRNKDVPDNVYPVQPVYVDSHIMKSKNEGEFWSGRIDEPPGTSYTR